MPAEIVELQSAPGKVVRQTAMPLPVKCEEHTMGYMTRVHLPSKYYDAIGETAYSLDVEFSCRREPLLNHPLFVIARVDLFVKTPRQPGARWG